jgi:hypothetical protein
MPPNCSLSAKIVLGVAPRHFHSKAVALRPLIGRVANWNSQCNIRAPKSPEVHVPSSDQKQPNPGLPGFLTIKSRSPGSGVILNLVRGGLKILDRQSYGVDGGSFTVMPSSSLAFLVASKSSSVSFTLVR